MNYKEYEAIAEVYSKYRRLMIDFNALDFPMLIAETTNLFEKHPGLRKLTQTIYPYVCVDEFQDTNFAQYKLLQHFIDPATKNLFVVADANQTIYRWNGADPKFIQDIHSRYQMHQIHLPCNFWCPTMVVEYANKLVKVDSSQLKQKASPIAHERRVQSSTVRVNEFDTLEEELDWVAQDIHVRSKKSSESFVVLARSNMILGHAVNALNMNGVNGFSGVRKTEFSDDSVQWLHTTLRLANYRCSQLYLKILCKSFSAVEGVEIDIDSILSRAMAEEEDYLRTWGAEVLNNRDVSEVTKEFIKNSLPSLIDRPDVWAFQDSAFQWLDTVNAKRNQECGFNEYEIEKSRWKEIIDQVTFKLDSKDITLHRLLQELDRRSKLRTPPEGSVPCFTIHTTKGMGFEHVYLVGMVENQLPSWHAMQRGVESSQMEEERRNCFVALTHTQKTVTITYSRLMLGYSTVPSRFLHEMELLK